MNMEDIKDSQITSIKEAYMKLIEKFKLVRTLDESFEICFCSKR